MRAQNHLVTLTGRRRGDCRSPSRFGRLRGVIRHAIRKGDMPPRTPGTTKNFRQRYDALEQRREELIARLTALGARARDNPGYGRARTLLNQTFRKSSLVQRAAVLEAAAWLIGLLDRSTMLP
jgi:hypothetical protein